MNNKLFIIVVAILLLAILGVFGFRYFQDMPKVSGNDSEKILGKYKEDLTGLYTELNGTYDRLAASKNGAEWEEFSKQWMPKLINVRPDVLAEKFPAEYEDVKITLMTAQSDFIPLWTEYNKDFTGEGSDPEKIREFRNRIENALNSVDI